MCNYLFFFGIDNVTNIYSPVSSCKIYREKMNYLSFVYLWRSDTTGYIGNLSLVSQMMQNCTWWCIVSVFNDLPQHQVHPHHQKQIWPPYFLLDETVKFFFYYVRENTRDVQRGKGGAGQGWKSVAPGGSGRAKKAPTEPKIRQKCVNCYWRICNVSWSRKTLPSLTFNGLSSNQIIASCIKDQMKSFFFISPL